MTKTHAAFNTSSTTHFEGTIPESFGNWTEVLYFFANNNNLVGSISKSWASWEKISVFDVSVNYLSGILSKDFVETIIYNGQPP